MFERYTEHARRAVFFAKCEAGLRDSLIEPEHLLLGLLREPAKIVAIVLERCGASVGAARDSAEAAFPVTAVAKPGDVPLSVLSGAVLRRAADASAAGHYLGVEHILCALLSEPSRASAILHGFGLTADRVSQATLELIAEHSQQQP